VRKPELTAQVPRLR